ncbi:phosphotransferase enzyme family protein [Paenibacillus humicola]|uniref:phosphotransferase enzyme family protein n=1 Tax=Paenibacillus humicola TaxID=3110540 RepID=UPI00237AD2AC|nr:aminoglycoside phosphotransferase family protein [Paenibacillus humicola]
MREQPKISTEHLRSRIQEQYLLRLIQLEFLPLGFDFQAGVFRAVSDQDAAYLIKVTSRPLYEPGCLVPRYLNDQGIDCVVAPVPTASGSLWIQVEGWTVMVYPFICGESSFTELSDGQWEKTGAVFKRIHRIALPAAGFESIRKETFNPKEYARRVRDFEDVHAHSIGKSAVERKLRAVWMAHRTTIHTVVTGMEKLGNALQKQKLTYVICHADLHPANLIRRDNEVFVIDWDEIMLAPKERDFIFVAQPEAHPFFAGYGDAEMDWPALTYYLLERVIQDLIECAQDVCFRDDLGEDSKEDALRLFQAILEVDGGFIDTAVTAGKHLPSDLMFRIEK